MRLVILAALCFVALAKLQNQQSQSQESRQGLYQSIRREKRVHDTVYRSGREYQYLYNGQVMTGIPGASRQHAGTRVKAVVLLQFKNSQDVLLKLTNARFGKINTEVSNPRKTQPMSIFEEVPVNPQLEQILEKPMKFIYADGMIKEISWEEGEQPWSANIKRGVLNMLQVNLKQHHRIETEEQQIKNSLRFTSGEVVHGSSKYFRALEKTLEGECETIYEVGRRPGRHSDASIPVLNVTKSIDFETCQKRPQIKYNWRFTEFCPTCEPKYQEDEKFLRSSTVVKYNITGNSDQFLIEQAQVESRYTFVPMQEGDSVVNTYVKQKLELGRTEPITTELRVASPMKSETDLLFSLRWDISKEKFFMTGENKFHQKTPYSAIPDKISVVSDLLRQLVTSIDEKVQEETPHHFSRLITILRMATRSELEQIQTRFMDSQHESFTPEEQKKSKDLMVSAMALAGTHDSIAHVVQKIRERKISPLTASLVLRQLQGVRVVSESMIQQIKSLIREPVVQENHQLKQAVWLTLGSLANALCSENEDQLAIEQKIRSEELCRADLKEELVKTFFNELKQANRWEDQLILIKAIKNAGIDTSIIELEKVVRSTDKFYPTFLRLQAILAMDNLREQMPRKIRKVLMPIYLNSREHPEVRMAAVHMILSTQPERPILEIIAKNLNNEPSRQVASFAWSYMNTLANSTNPCFQNMTSDLKLALRFTKEIRPGVQYSKFVNFPFHAPKLGLGADINLFNLMSNESLIPVRSSVTLDTNTLGMWNRYFATVGFSAEGLEPLIYQLIGENGIFSESTFEDMIWKRNTPRSGLPYEQELKQLFQSLKIKSRDYSREAKAWVDLRLKGQEVGFLPLSKDVITNFLRDGSINMKDIEQKLRQGVQINTHKATMLREMSFKIPTTIGMPLLWKIKVPAVLGLRGKVQLQLQDGLSKLVLSGDLKTSVAVSAVQTMEIWSPIVNSGVNVKMEARAFAPLKGQLQAHLKESPKQVKLVLEPPKSPKELLVVETRPTTFTFIWPSKYTAWKDADEKTIKGEEFNRVESTEQSYGRKTVGIELKIRSRWHKSPAKRIPGTPLIPYSGPNKLVVQMLPGVNQPAAIELKLDAMLNRNSEQKFMSNLKLKTFDQFPGDSSNSESVSESQSVSASQERLNQNQKQDKRQFKYTQKNLKRSNSRQTSKSSQDSSEESFEAQPQGTTRQNQLNIEIVARGPMKRQAMVTISHQYTTDLRYNRLNAKLQCMPVPQLNLQPFNIHFDSEIVYPKQPNTVEETISKKVVGQAQLKWGESTTSNNFITLKVQAERSQAQKEYEQLQRQQRDECQYYKSQKVDSPVACYEKIAEMAMLKKYTIDIEYNHVPVVVRNITSKVLNYLKYRYYWQTDVANINVQNAENKIQAKIYLDPETNQRINVTIKTPRQNITMTSIPLPVRVTPLNTRRFMMSQYLYDITNEKYQTGAMCKVTDRKLQTLDGSRLALPLSTCYTLLAKDCLENGRFAVLIKKISENTQQKKLKIITPLHKIVLTAGNPMKLEINGQERPINDHEVLQEHGHEVTLIKRQGSFVQIHHLETGIRVQFDGYAANIMVSPLYMHRQCGLCGHYDSEPGFDNEFLTPSMQRAQSMHSFYRDYTMVEGECALPTNFEKHNWQWQSNESSEESSEESKSSSSSASSSSSESAETNTRRKSSSTSSSSSSESKEMNFSYKTRGAQKPTLRTLKVERLGKSCFSVQKVLRCPRGTMVTKYEQELKQVEYRCLSNRDSQTGSWMNSFESSEEKSSEIPDLRQTKLSFHQKERVPKSCQKH